MACKEWNNVPEDGLNLLGMSFDNTGALGANTWRHVAFIEQDRPLGAHDAGLTGLPTGPPASEEEAGVVAAALPGTGRGGGDLGTAPVDLGFPSFELPGAATGAETRTEFRWLMSSDVCKHCTHAGCLDVCPTGALFRTEFGTVVVQQDICNGCGYCVSGLPVRGHRPAARTTARAQQMHAVLRPAARRPGTGLRQGLPDQVDPVRPARTSCASRPRSGSRTLHARGRRRGPALR